MDTVGASTAIPASNRDTASIVKKLPCTIIGGLTTLTRCNIKEATAMDEDGLDV
jgi:hypothetical protein